MTRVFVICGGLLGLLGLNACGGEVGLMVVGASMATLIHTDKTIVDHAVGRSTDQDCSVLYLARDEDYCKPLIPIEPSQVAYMASTLYCYRTLGGVSCYDRPDYSASSQTRIVFGDTLIAPLASPPLASRSEPAIQ